jgi:putative ABC transport system permease protein
MSTTMLQDLRFGLRVLLAKPGFMLAAVLTLALGIGANTAIFSVVKAVILDPLPYPHPEQLVTLAQGNSESERNPLNIGYTTFVDWQQQLHSVSSIAVFADWQASISGNGDANLVTGMRVSPQFFSVLGTAPLLGRTFSVEEDQSGQHDVVVLSSGLWQRQFGADPAIVGRKVTINGRDRTVVGVLSPQFKPAFYGNVSGVPEIWLPLGYRLSDESACRDCLHLQAVARLQPNAELRGVRAELDALAQREIHDYPDKYPKAMRFVATPLQATLIGDAPKALWLLLAAAGLVLLIACVDVGNLVLVRAQGRRRELAVRSALGARRTRLAKLLLAESALVALGGGVFGVLFAFAGVRALVNFGSASVARLETVTLDPYALVFAAVLSVLVTLLTGLWPALRSSRFRLDEALKAGARATGSTGSMRVQAILVVSQIVLAFVLAVGAALVMRSFAGLLSVEPGFDPHDVVGLNISTIGPRYSDSAQVRRFYEQLLERMRASPGVSDASIVSSLPMSGNYDRAGFHIKDRPIAGQEAPEVDRYFVSTGYFATLHIPLLRGRDFSAADRADSAPVAVVSATLAQTMWPKEDAIGKQIQLGGRDEAAPWATVVGIVGNVRQYGLDVALTPQAYEPHAQQPADPMTLLIRSPLQAEAVAASVRSAVRAIDPAVPVYAVAPLQQRIADTLARRRLTLTLFALFAFTALGLAAIGIYGVVSYTISQQTQALGLRRALGASNASVLRWVLRRSASYAAYGMLIGIPAALLWGRMLASELVGISQHDLPSFIAVGVALSAVVILASIGPAWRALRIAPTVALRYE